MMKIRFNRRSLCAGDDINNGIYDIEMPDAATLKDLIYVLAHGGNGNDWPLPQNHAGWLIYSNRGYLAWVSSDKKSAVYFLFPETERLSELGLKWVFGECNGESPEETAFKCKGLFR